MDVSDITNYITNFLSDVLRVPTISLVWPDVIPNLIVPFILLWYAFYKILERIGIFGYHSGINVVIASVITIPMIMFIPQIATLSIIFSVAVIWIVGIQSARYKILFTIVMILYYFFIIPNLSYLQV